MVFLEMATLGVAAFGLMNYRDTKILQANISALKSEYGEHPDIDEAFDDICKLAGEQFILPRLDLESNTPHIYTGTLFNRQGPNISYILDEFFLMPKEKLYFWDKYEEEFEKQAEIRTTMLEEMYYTVEPIYRKGEFENFEGKRMKSRRYTSPRIAAPHMESLQAIIDDMSENTLWGEIFEAGPIIHQADIHWYNTEWYIKEEVFNKIKCIEAYDVLLQSSYYHVRRKHF